MIQFTGPKGSGKSTLLRLAASTWMAPGTLRTWSDTMNQIEWVATASSGTVLVLDELGSYDWAKPKSFLSFRTMVMRLFEGSMRGRMNQASASWRLAMLSSSNMSIAELAANIGSRMDDEFYAAMRTRLIDVPPPIGGHGVFECLHGHRSVDDFVAQVLLVLQDHHGRSGPVFVERMLRWRDSFDDGGAALLRDWRGAYLKAARRRFADSPLAEFGRVHQIFATIYASGRLGIRLGVLPWNSQDFAAAVLHCEAAHIALARSANLSAPVHEEPLEMIRRHVRVHWETISDLRAGLLPKSADGNHRSRNGYILRRPNGQTEFFVSNEKLVEICGGISSTIALKRGLEASCPSFGGERRHSVRRPIYVSGGREQGIAIPGALLELRIMK